MAWRWTFVTSGHVASITRSPRLRASSRTAGATPWALKITVAVSGTSWSSSTKMAPLARSLSTTYPLWTISRRTYTGGPRTPSHCAPVSMARSTPAQKPRGPARTISPIRVTIRLLLKIKGYARPPGIRLETTNGVRGVAVGDVDQPVPGVEGHIVRHEVRRAHAAGQPEREARVDLHDLEVGAAGRGEQLDVRHEPPQRQEVIPAGEREARVVGPVRLRVVLINRLEPGLERAVEERPARERVPRHVAQTRARVEQLDVGLPPVILEVVLLAAAALEGRDPRPLLERQIGIEGVRGQCDGERHQRDEPEREPHHGSIRTFNASPRDMRSRARPTSASPMRCVTSPSGSSVSDSSKSTARRIRSGVW